MKPVYLPNFVIALVRTPRLPPTFAQFAVPLSLNKLDLKNYLKNAYGIKVLGVRSSIRQQPVEIEQQGGARRYVRKQAEKRMIIEMEEPFVWPEEPQDLTKYFIYTPIPTYYESDDGKLTVANADSITNSTRISRSLERRCARRAWMERGTDLRKAKQEGGCHLLFRKCVMARQRFLARKHQRRNSPTLTSLQPPERDKINRNPESRLDQIELKGCVFEPCIVNIEMYDMTTRMIDVNIKEVLSFVFRL
ncbi:hypothetical protein TWF788_001351 [Orbilia oligospora]|uniref:Large ribosomal subunit protein uL23m n=1 Tax=Orbilia oligospora TaxID=2813651 RepID=A0A7C8PLI7_ORBOL|nr:hypothetical protein TWF788_001351 [Orbilia oligospora]